jgi:thiamine-phosphate pyrophosphorylase
MHRRQRVPRQWLVVTSDSAELAGAVRRLKRGSGVLLLAPLGRRQMTWLRQLALHRGLTVMMEQPGKAARVHNVPELRAALLRRTPLILLSPIYATRTHPEWQPIPRMRAATLARLAGRRLVALGGMNARKFARVEDLGFQAWAGITAFRT